MFGNHAYCLPHSHHDGEHVAQRGRMQDMRPIWIMDEELIGFVKIAYATKFQATKDA